MKRISQLICLLLLLQASSAQSFNQIAFKNIDGDTVQASSYAGKKVLFVIAPLSQTDSSFSQLLNFKSRYGDTVQIIGVLSIEDGYLSSNKAAVQTLYSNSGITLTEGMYTKKSSGSNQSNLMKWLTDKNKNLRFNDDAKGIGHKFFVTGGGRLYAVMPAQVTFAAPVISTIVHSSSQ